MQEAGGVNPPGEARERMVKGRPPGSSAGGGLVSAGAGFEVLLASTMSLILAYQFGELVAPGFGGSQGWRPRRDAASEAGRSWRQAAPVDQVVREVHRKHRHQHRRHDHIHSAKAGRRGTRERPRPPCSSDHLNLVDPASAGTQSALLTPPALIQIKAGPPVPTRWKVEYSVAARTIDLFSASAVLTTGARFLLAIIIVDLAAHT
jgi:hypothetical protein